MRILRIPHSYSFSFLQHLESEDGTQVWFRSAQRSDEARDRLVHATSRFRDAGRCECGGHLFSTQRGGPGAPAVHRGSDAHGVLLPVRLAGGPRGLQRGLGRGGRF